jgi:glycosyltransferase involved in cell wall biosynthesis
LRVLFLAIGPEDEPSSRFRAYQWLAPLRGLGIEAEVRPRVGRAYFELGFGLRRPPAPVRWAWVAASVAARVPRRLRDLWQARRFDVVVVQKESFPLGMERLVSAFGLRVLYDVDDAVWLRPPGGDGLGRGLRALAERLTRRDRALARLLPRCRGVLAGSAVLADWTRTHAARVTRLPTVVDTDAYPVRLARRQGTVTIGWIGAPANAVYLERLRPVFEALCRRYDVRVLLLGPAGFDAGSARVEVRGWRHYRSRDDEARDLREIDIGIMPLPDEPFAAGKCALKIIQYMASGIPVVASPVGANAEVVADGDTGYLAGTPQEWEARLAELIEDPERRAAMGRAGRARAEAHYSVRSALPVLVAALREAAGAAPVVEPSGIEPPTSALRTQRSPN